MIEQLLKQLDFTDNQIAIYMVIFERGKVLPADVAAATGINRTTVYAVIKELVKKGVVSEDLAGPTKYVVALPPEEFLSVIEHQEQVLKKKREVTKMAVEKLKSLEQNQTYSPPKIVFVSEEDVSKFLYKQTNKWNNSIMARDGGYWGFQDQHFVKHYEHWIDEYWTKHRSSDPVTLRLLSDKYAETIKGEKYERRKILFWDKTENFSATTWVMGDYVVMIYAEHRPHYLVEIHDQVFAHNLREVFKGIWTELSEKSE